jgi:hypothetical protein
MPVEFFQKVNAVANKGNSPSLQSGNFAQRPAVAANGSVYIAWDTQEVFAYVAGAWVLIASTGGASPVSSVFTRTGAIVAQAGDYAAFYLPISYTPPVLSVFTRTGAIAAQVGDYAAFYLPLSFTADQLINLNGKTLDIEGLYGIVQRTQDGVGSAYQVFTAGATQSNADNQDFNYSALVIQRPSGGVSMSVADGSGNVASATVSTGGVDSPVVISDLINNVGQTYDLDYSANGKSLPRWIPDNGYMLATFPSIANTRNASNFGLTASLATVAALAVPGTDQTYKASGWINISTVVTDTVTLKITFIDNQSNVRTLNFFVQGATVAAVGVAGYYAFPDMTFRALAGTTITMSTTVVGAGSINYAVGGIIALVQGF